MQERYTYPWCFLTDDFKSSSWLTLPQKRTPFTALFHTCLCLSACHWACVADQFIYQMVPVAVFLVLFHPMGPD